MSRVLSRFGGEKRDGLRVRLLALVAVLALLGAACGGAEERPTGDDGEEIDLVAFCEGAITGEARFSEGPELDDEGNPTEESLEELRTDMEPLLADIEQNTPEEISSEVETVLGGVRSALETGDPAAFQNVEFMEADTAMDEYVFENCEFDATEEFVAVDYAYEGLPETLSPGRTAFRLDNQGSEVHEAVIFRINDDVDTPLRELLDLPDDEVEEMIQFRGVTFAGPGDAGYGVVELDAGRYGFICFIPVGTTSMESLFEEGEEGDEGEGASPTPTDSPTASPSPTGSPAEGDEDDEGEGAGPPPHFTEGMFAEVTVS